VADAADALGEGRLPPVLTQTLGVVLVNDKAVKPEEESVLPTLREAFEGVDEVQKGVLPRVGEKDVWPPDKPRRFRILMGTGKS
jgi:hypothetical protein